MAEYESLDHELASKGYLSLRKALEWFKIYHPSVAISYPTALKLIRDEKLVSIKVGKMHRFTRLELERFAAHGNREDLQEDSVDQPEQTKFKIPIVEEDQDE